MSSKQHNYKYDVIKIRTDKKSGNTDIDKWIKSQHRHAPASIINLIRIAISLTGENKDWMKEAPKFERVAFIPHTNTTYHLMGGKQSSNSSAYADSSNVNNTLNQTTTKVQSSTDTVPTSQKSSGTNSTNQEPKSNDTSANNNSKSSNDNSSDSIKDVIEREMKGNNN